MTELRHRGGTTEPHLQQQQSEDKVKKKNNQRDSFLYNGEIWIRNVG